MPKPIVGKAKPPVQYELPPRLYAEMSKRHLTPQDVAARCGIMQERYTDILSGRCTPNYSPELDGILTMGFGLRRYSPEYFGICRVRVQDWEKQKKDPQRRRDPTMATQYIIDDDGRKVPTITPLKTASGSSA